MTYSLPLFVQVALTLFFFKRSQTPNHLTRHTGDKWHVVKFVTFQTGRCSAVPEAIFRAADYSVAVEYISIVTGKIISWTINTAISVDNTIIEITWSRKRTLCRRKQKRTLTQWSPGPRVLCREGRKKISSEFKKTETGTGTSLSKKD